MAINIAIDGPSAAGKSTIAKKLAKKLGYVHLDTGAMYRCTAYKALQKGISLEDEKDVCSMLAKTEIELTSEGKVLLDGADVTMAIRADEISLAASKVSKLVRVREDLVRRQQKMAEAKGYIMDGRDIGTVVLKDAEVKIFMTASPEARAKRRYDQNIANHIPTGDVAEIAEDIRKRDYEDTHRKASPLCKAEDASEIDTSNMTIDEVCCAIEALAQPFLEKENA
ncbi:MAG: (d)CMP kinase [Solobacterium sp.]|jgi:cytidylate kinase|nr:(d)CMP kinase [Solobacterium sp.]MCH4205206.1 (d)CMP kinase [Solobacterium sp.]MCH4226799.1 (d)CMP kinase [Solobacterium sp.]MCH4281559.1 (d)CMP kinase [Solobacterium sp.]